MNNILLNRRREMMQVVKGYKVNWYPIIQGSITSQDMINEYGDLFRTYDDAPDTHPTIYQHPAKTSAFALDKSITAIQLGGNSSKDCIVYEEGQAPIIMAASFRETINFVSNQTYKHVVCYNSNLGGNQALTGVGWIINEKANFIGIYVIKFVKYWHIPYESNVSVSMPENTNINNTNPICYEGSVYYIPDWWSGAVGVMRYKRCSKIRFSKGVTFLYNSIYFFGNVASEIPNLTDIYAHWGLGEVPQQPGSRFTGQWKLHIPDLGNAEDNAALVAEYRSKGWNYVSGLGIFNDVETTEPQEQTT